MKGSDKVKMTLNIAGELISLDVEFDEQNSVRDVERDLKSYIDRMRKNWPQISDRQILARTAYQYAKWYHRLLNIQQEAINLSDNAILAVDNHLNSLSAYTDATIIEGNHN